MGLTFHDYLFLLETLIIGTKTKFSWDSTFTFYFLSDISKDKLSEFQIILYLELTLDMKPFQIQQYVSFMIGSITFCYFNHRNKHEAYIPTLTDPITQQARRLHAADLRFLPSDSLTFPLVIIYIEDKPQTK